MFSLKPRHRATTGPPATMLCATDSGSGFQILACINYEEPLLQTSCLGKMDNKKEQDMVKHTGQFNFSTRTLRNTKIRWLLRGCLLPNNIRLSDAA